MTRRAFTDVFIRHPVLAIVVNLVIVVLGWRALTTLPVQQYPKLDSASVLITTVYTGASAETVRGFLTTPIERAVSAISGVDYVESTSRAGLSTVTVRLKLNHDPTAALAEVTARLQQVRAELPAEAEPPVVEVQRADRPYASFYISFTSGERGVPAITDWLARTLQPQLATLPGVQRVTIEGGRQLAMRVWIDPDRLAALNLAPGDVQAALQRNNYLAAVGQTKGNLVQINLLANTDLRAADEFRDLIVAERNGAIVRLSDVARVELGAEEAEVMAKLSDREAVYLGVWPLVGSNEIEVAHRLRAEMDGRPLTHEHVRGTLLLILIAGIDTTWSAIGASLWHLAQHPEDRRRLAGADDMAMTLAVEEFLRAYAPVTMARIVAADVELGGRQLRRGDWCLLPFPAANRDPAVFERADEVVLDRAVNRHAAFGLGIHRCLGSNLARMELRVALEEWMRRIPDFELTDPSAVTWSKGQVRGPRRIPIRVVGAGA